MKGQEILTARLCLRPAEPRDAAALALIRSTEFVCRYNLYTPVTEEEMREELSEKEGFALTSRADGRVIGFMEYKPDGFRYRCASLELAAYLGEADAGQGYIPEALEAVKRYLFEETDTTRLSINIFVGNTASVKVVERSGFTCEGCLAEAVCTPDGRVFDLLLYSLSKRDYLHAENGFE